MAGTRFGGGRGGHYHAHYQIYFLVKAPSDLPYALEQAWQTMLEGRMGPVAVDITKDVFLSEVPESAPETTCKTAAYDDAGAAAKAVFSYLSKASGPSCFWAAA